MPALVALLDANVIFPVALRDTLFRIYKADFSRMCLPEQILEEVRRNLVRREMTVGKADRLINIIKREFAETLIAGHEYLPLVEYMHNDPKDRRVLAAAVVGRAQIIVTNNLKDFPVIGLAALRKEENIEAK